MRAIRRWVKAFFVLSQSQANGMMILLPLLFVWIVSEPVWRWWRVKNWTPDSRDAAMLDSLATIWRYQMADSLPNDNERKAGLVPQKGDKVKFIFDPNTASQEDLIRLGFEPKLARRIDNFRTRGGTFKTGKDMLRIYDMDTALIAGLQKFIRITPVARGQSKARPPALEQKPPSYARNHLDEPFDINRADSARLEAVRGIGEKLSRRIIKYRSSLGGFVHIKQLAEVFGLDSVTFHILEKTAFVAPDFLPDRIDLNTADEKLLDAHPYLSRQEARAIVAYRFQHGRFASASDLRMLPLFDDEKVRRLEPYLTVNN